MFVVAQFIVRPLAMQVDLSLYPIICVNPENHRIVQFPNKNECFRVTHKNVLTVTTITRYNLIDYFEKAYTACSSHTIGRRGRL